MEKVSRGIGCPLELYLEGGQGDLKDRQVHRRHMVSYERVGKIVGKSVRELMARGLSLSCLQEPRFRVAVPN